MYLEKIIMDYKTILVNPILLDTLKNCDIYISISNYNELKLKINKLANDNSLSNEIKTDLLKRLRNIIKFIQNNNNQIQSCKSPETERILYNNENNCYMIIVNDVVNIDKMFAENNNEFISKEVYDTMSVALLENAQIMTLNEKILTIISENKLPIFAINLNTAQA